jgi:hypothetical protein
MNATTEVLGRLLARRQGRALPIRSTSALSPDPNSVFAIAPIKMVAEEIVQAIAFGDPDAMPQVVTRWNPLSRDAGDLETFAAALNDYVEAVASGDQLPRFWLPHRSALTVVELLGHRYRTNQMANDSLRRMGWQCRAIAEEATYGGQQGVAIAGELLRAHVLTGQAPVKDGHLGALLAWAAPAAGHDPAAVADERALVPASGVLERPIDDRVEGLRREAKRGRAPVAARARAEIEAHLARAALDEWQLMLEARRAFWSLGLPEGPGLGPLVAESRRHLLYMLRQDLNPPSRPHSLARLVDDHEYAADLAEDADVRGDLRVRELARRKGRALLAEVVQVQQPRSSRRPCHITLRTTQEVLRVRQGTVLRDIGGMVEGRVEDVWEADGATLLRLELIKGVQRSRVPAIGDRVDWVDTAPRDLRRRRREIHDAMQAAASPLVYGEGVVGVGASGPPSVDLLAMAERLRRGA